MFRGVTCRVAGIAAIACLCVAAQPAVPPALQEHLDRAQVLLDQQKYTEMVRELRSAIAIWPQTPGAYYQLGFGLFQLGQPVAAETYFTKELKFEPPDPFSLYYLGRIKAAANQRLEALKFFQRSLEIGEVLDVRQRVASAYVALGQIGEAIRFLEASVKLKPEDGGLHYLLARAYQKSGDATHARSEFAAAERWKAKAAEEIQSLNALRQALTKRDRPLAEALLSALEHSSDPDILTAGAAVLGQAELHEDAAALLRKAIEIQPKLPEAHYNLARAYIALGSHERVEAELASAVQLKPEFYEAQILLGTILAEAGQSEQAIKHLRQAAALRTPTPRLMMILGLQYYQQRYYAEAAKALNSAVQLDPANRDARFLLIQAYYQNLEYERALALAKETRDRFPENALAHYHVAAQLNNFGRFAEARESLQLTLGKDPNLLEARVMLGEVLFRLGENEASLREFRRALDQDPKWMDAHAGLGKVLIQLKMFAEAASAMEAALRLDSTLPSLHLYVSRAYLALGRVEDAKREAQIFAKLNESRAKARDANVERKYPDPPGA